MFLNYLAFLSYLEINYFLIVLQSACGNGYCELVPHLIFCSNIVNYMMCQDKKVHSYFYLALIAYKIVCLDIYVCMVLAAQLELKEIVN